MRREVGFTIHNSQFTIHDSQFTIHNSQFTIHNSQFTIHNFTDKLGYVEGVVDFGGGGVRNVV